MFNRIIGFIIILQIQACTTFFRDQSWSADLPPQKIFIEYCQNISKGCTTSTETNDHLIWVKRFYNGSILSPNGWNHMSEMVTSSLDNTDDVENTKDRLDKLGLRISLEWARDNDVRLINSQMLSTWANALSISAQQDQQIEFITKLEDDVEKIYLGLLNPDEITRKRYYHEVQDYDDF